MRRRSQRFHHHPRPSRSRLGNNRQKPNRRRRRFAIALGAAVIPPIFASANEAAPIFVNYQTSLYTYSDYYAEWDSNADGINDGCVVYKDAADFDNPTHEPAIHFTERIGDRAGRPNDGFSPVLLNDPPVGTTDPARIYATGDLISYAGPFRISLYRTLSELTTKHYFALKMSTAYDSNGQGTNQVLSYFSLLYDPGWNEVIVSDFAYESTPGADLFVGGVPEPSSLVSLAVGSTALLATARRRRNERS